MVRFGIGESQVRILENLKRWGSSTIPRLAGELHLSVETVRAHLKILRSEGLVRRGSYRRVGRGRPEGVYRLTESAQSLFPNREGQLLQGLVRFLKEEGQADLVGRFFREWADQHRPKLRRRLQGMEGDERLQELARALSEEGFMAEVQRTADGQPLLRLCNCPMEGLVSVTVEPCRFESQLIEEMIGDSLTRIDFIPSGAGSCSYAVPPERQEMMESPDREARTSVVDTVRRKS